MFRKAKILVIKILAFLASVVTADCLEKLVIGKL